MKRYFEYKDGVSNKFWEIEETPTNKIIRRYGRIGTPGSIKEETVNPYSLKAKNYIKSKLNKGYKEVPIGNPSITIPKTTMSIDEIINKLQKGY